MQKEVYLVIVSDGEDHWVEAVSFDKTKAEALMRDLIEQDVVEACPFYTYQIQVKPLI